MNLSGPDQLSALELAVPAERAEDLELVLAFDGRESVRAKLADAFAQGRRLPVGGRAVEAPVPTRSLLVGRAEGLGVDHGERLRAARQDPASYVRLYNYFPMPFERAAAVRLRLAEGPRSGPAVVSWRLRRAGRPPHPESGHFGLQVFPRPEGAAPVPAMAAYTGQAPLVRLQGRGKWVALFAELGSVGRRSREYLEGDERVVVDGGSPALGTGVEDFFDGGFYFDRGPFARALSGAPYHRSVPAPGRRQGRRTSSREDVTAAYRLRLTDAVPFGSSLEVDLETGPTGELPLRARTVAFYYLLP